MMTPHVCPSRLSLCINLPYQRVLPVSFCSVAMSLSLFCYEAPHVHSVRGGEESIPEWACKAFAGWRCSHAAFPAARFWHFPVTLYASLAFHCLSPSLLIASWLFTEPHNSPCSTWQPTLFLLNLFLTWQDGSVVWWLLSIFPLKWVSGTLPF